MDSDPSFQRHPPERRRRSTSAPAAACCCCTCCCCMHSVGAIVGAGVASRKILKAIPDEADEERRLLQRAPVVIYWKSFAIAVLILAGSLRLANPSEDLRWVGVLALICLPLASLGAGLVGLYFVAFGSHPDRAYCYRKLGFITLWSFLGGVAGTALMAPLLLF